MVAQRDMSLARLALLKVDLPLKPLSIHPHTMAPTVARSNSQSKISDTFRSSGKPAKQNKQNKPVIQPTTESSPPAPQTIQKDGKHLNENDPNLRSAAEKIETKREAPFGSVPVILANDSTSGKSEYLAHHFAGF
jgi:hypothetical protein